MFLELAAIHHPTAMAQHVGVWELGNEWESEEKKKGKEITELVAFYQKASKCMLAYVIKQKQV